MVKEYDILIIGGGPAGYVSAIRASQLGFTVALVEQDELGGTCLNRGCVPSKSFIKSAETFTMMQKAANLGISCSDIKVNLDAIKNRTSGIINQLKSGVASLLFKHKVEVFKHRARLMGSSIFSPMPGSVSIPSSSGEENDIITGKYIILCTGSSIKSLPGLPYDGEFILSSDDMFQLKRVPKSIIIVGGGVIGLEWASLLNALGTKVTVVEVSDRILPMEDKDISQELHKQLSAKGIDFHFNLSLDSKKLEKKDAVIKCNLNNTQGETVHTLQTEKIFVAIGRKPNTYDLGLDNTKIDLDTNGYIKVNEHFMTKEKHIFAVGDIINFVPLAHAASAAGVYVVEYLKGLKPFIVKATNIPRCVYSSPEVASVGLTEAQAKELGVEVQVSKFPYLANAKSTIEGSEQGFIKIIGSKTTDEILGVHIIGSKATELIATPTVAKFLESSVLELGKAVYAHPSLSEIIGEAALSMHLAAIHK